MKTLLIPILSLAMLAGCKLGPDYKAPEMAAPATWNSSFAETVSSIEANEKWWKTFGDPLLEKLIDEASANNHSIRIAVANIKQAKALRAQSYSLLLPTVDASGAAEKQGLSRKSTTNNNSAGAKERDIFDAGLDAAWEIDIFGANRRAVESADAAIQAAEEERNNVMLSIMAEVARNYFEVRGLQKRIEVTERNIELLREVEELAKAQSELGVVTEFDVARARGQRESTEATLPNLQAELAAGIYRISVLTGQSPEKYYDLLNQYKPLPSPPDKVPVGLPSDLMRRRPDIRQAERELASSTAEIGVATADLFPKFSITGGIGTSAAAFGDLFTSGAGTYSIASGITAPIFHGGELRARLEGAKANTEGTLANYEKTVLEAIEETESSLIRYGKEWQTMKGLRSARNTNEDAFKIAKLRYEAGEENFLVILDAERNLVEAEDQLIQSETRILTNLTQLYKALGGGWQEP